MRGIAASASIALAAAGCAGGGHHADHGSAGIPYACDGGRAARIVHLGGGYAGRARAELSFEGRSVALAAAPGAEGLRYASAADEAGGTVWIWSETGEEARLAEAESGDAAEGREIARCTRIRTGDAPAGHAPDHH